jgi:uncharacterized membrane protein
VRQPSDDRYRSTNHVRRVWVQNIVDKKRDIPAVQTFRDWVMASTLLASTAILISLGLVASAFRTETASSATHALNVFGHPSETLRIIKLFVLSALFFYALFNFTLSIRYYNPASFLIILPQDREPSSSVDSVSLILNRGALHYTFGLRGFYLAIPVALWLFGPLWMLEDRYGWCLSSAGWTGKSDPATTRNDSAATVDLPNIVLKYQKFVCCHAASSIVLPRM